LHQEIQPFGVFGDNLVLAILNSLPVQLAFTQAVNPVFLSCLQMVVHLGVEQESLSGDTAHVQAGAAQLVVFFDQAGFQPELACAECGCISARSSADNGNVINGFWQGSALLV